MSYALLAQVQGFVPLFPIGSGSVPSTTQVQQYIDSRSNEIDSTLASLGYSTPITAPAELVADLAQLNAKAAAADVWASVFISSPGVNPQANAAALLKDYETRLAEIRSGVSVPVGLGYTESNRAPRSYFTDTQSIGQDVDAFDAWGNRVHSDPRLRRDRVY